MVPDLPGARRCRRRRSGVGVRQVQDRVRLRTPTGKPPSNPGRISSRQGRSSRGDCSLVAGADGAGCRQCWTVSDCRGRSWNTLSVVLVCAVVAGCASGSGVHIGATSPGSTGSTDSVVTVTTIGSFQLPTTSTSVETTTPSTASSPSTTEAATGAATYTLSPSDSTAIAQAFAAYAHYSFCPVQIVPGTFRAATVASTGSVWAFGTLEPLPGCTVAFSTGQRIDANKVAPFGGGVSGSSGIFELQTGGSWVMNSFESFPFPCPPIPGKSPGPGNPWVPLAVLNATSVSYAPSNSCANAFTPSP